MGVNSHGEMISTRSRLVENSVGGDTSGFQSSMSDLNSVRDFERQFDREISPAVAHFELNESAVGDSPEIFAASVRLTFDFSVHRCGFSCHLQHLMDCNGHTFLILYLRAIFLIYKGKSQNRVSNSVHEVRVRYIIYYRKYAVFDFYPRLNRNHVKNMKVDSHPFP